jgi:predicted RNA binding protein YcfA (HicA-like mRNA interferase family)
MRMQGFKPQEMIRIVHKNGWKEVGNLKGSHLKFIHPDFKEHLEIPVGHNQELSRPLIKRLIKQFHLVINT